MLYWLGLRIEDDFRSRGAILYCLGIAAPFSALIEFDTVEEAIKPITEAVCQISGSKYQMQHIERMQAFSEAKETSS